MKRGRIVAENLGRRFRVYANRNVTLKEAIVRRGDLRATEIWAVRGVNLKIEPGESVAFIGRNGSGKTTLLRLIAGIFAPTEGTLVVEGKIGSLLELGAGFHADFTGRENIYLSASIYGMPRRLVDERLEDIIAFSELEEFIDLPVRTYSSGMYMRLGFAIAAHIEADILLLDEVFAVGDEAFQRKCVDHVMRFRQNGGTVCFVSHDAGAVERLCERALLLDHGRIEFEGETNEAVKRYQAKLAAEESPEELRGGLREWGSGEARITDVQLDNVGEIASGAPLVVRMQLHVETPIEPPRLFLELRNAGGGLIGSSVLDLTEVGWDGASGDRALRFTIDRLPLAEGRFQLSVALTDRSGSKRYHRIDKAVEFAVKGSGDTRGLLRLEGDWSADGVEVGAP